MSPRVVIYARYSSEMQREASIDDQVRLCRERIAQNDWHFLQVFSDSAISGSTTLRPGYQRVLEAARLGQCDIVLAEALDRLSRDQEDVAALYKRLNFAGVRLVTLSEGEVSELHVGLKGTMNALFLKDLAAKTHRGLRGRIEAGLSGGGNAYGYRVVRSVDAGGNVVTGQRQIDADQALIVQRIFRAYAAGTSPRQIALALNEDGVSAPRTRSWSSSTINGNRARGTGVLNNELYIGRLIWNRLTYVKDPDTGRRRSRKRASCEGVVKEVPDLRIVDQELWDAVRMRQAALDRKGQAELDRNCDAPFWAQRRPRYLFSGLLKCGVCGGGFSKISQQHFGCSTARNKGPTACPNLLGIRRDVLEQTVLDGLANRIMDPELFKIFVADFLAEWNRLQAEASGDRNAWQSELDRLKHQIERLVDAIATNGISSSLAKRLNEHEARCEQLERQIAEAVNPAPRMHPNLAEVYRQTVARLIEVLAGEDAVEAREHIRSLVDAVILTPKDGKLTVAVRGELASILSLSAAGRTVSSSRSAGALAEQVKMVAGIGFEPMTFRL